MRNLLRRGSDPNVLAAIPWNLIKCLATICPFYGIYSLWVYLILIRAEREREREMEFGINRTSYIYLRLPRWFDSCNLQSTNQRIRYNEQREIWCSSLRRNIKVEKVETFETLRNEKVSKVLANKIKSLRVIKYRCILRTIVQLQIESLVTDAPHTNLRV